MSSQNAVVSCSTRWLGRPVGEQFTRQFVEKKPLIQCNLGAIVGVEAVGAFWVIPSTEVLLSRSSRKLLGPMLFRHRASRSGVIP